MNKTEVLSDIELPPLPRGVGEGCTLAEFLHDYARQAIVADRAKLAEKQGPVSGVVIDGTLNTPALVKRGTELEHVSKWGGSLLYTHQPVTPALEDAPAGSGGWKAYAESMERERDYYRTRAQTMYEHQRGEVWYWQGDGHDHPESMANSLPVVIRADDLRALIAPVTPALVEAAERVPAAWDAYWQSKHGEKEGTAFVLAMNALRAANEAHKKGGA